MMVDRGWMSAAEASRLLRVSRATLYAYVSRGFVRSQATAGSSRERRYSRDDVERLRRRTEERRDPDKAVARGLSWGVPVLSSSIALIDGQRLFYRGHDAVALSRSRSIEEIASLIWTGDFTARFPPPRRPSTPAATDVTLPFVPRAQAALARGSVRDPHAFDLRAGSVPLTGWRILHLLTEAATLSRVSGATIEATLGRAWGVGPRGVDVLRSALILSADHELNVSSFTARCVASAGSHPYAVVAAGLAALGGTRHGGASARAESMLASLSSRRAGARRLEREGFSRATLQAAVADRLRRGETIDGFGHPLYRDGDPRATALLEQLRDRYRRSGELAFVLDVCDAAGSTLREKPNIDFALAALVRVLRLPPGSALTLFAIGRTIGWIGHAIEQYESGQLIRPRARYVGVAPH